MERTCYKLTWQKGKDFYLVNNSSKRINPKIQPEDKATFLRGKTCVDISSTKIMTKIKLGNLVDFLRKRSRFSSS